jgi:hypothetical protein
MLADDDDNIGVAEARAAVKQNQEMEEAKAELQELKGSDEDEAGEGDNEEGDAKVEGVEGSETMLVGQKRSRDPALNQAAK